MKIKRKIILVILLIFGLTILLNLKVYTRQGINYKVSSIEIPLYLKVLDFYDRHYNYRSLVTRVTKGSLNQEEKIFRLFNWVYANIKPQPQGLPVVDDHVWHIIVRGYGIGEQSSDVFTTLCNYSGTDAYYLWIKGKEENKLPFSFVKINKQWIVFDVLNGVCFRNRQGGFASLSDIENNNWIPQSIRAAKELEFDYREYFYNFPKSNTLSSRLERSSIQSPLNRLIFQIERLMKVK